MPSEPQTSPFVSVVVPAYNAEQTLDACIGALLNQDLGRERYDVLVVDNKSADGTADIIRRYRGEGVVGLSETRPGPAWARNAGVDRATGEIVAFTDSDCVPQTDWLRSIIEPIVDGAADVCGGRVVPVSTETEIERFGEAWFWPIDKFVSGEFFCMPYAITANAAYRSETLRAVSGFDTSFPIAGYEDTDLGWRAFQAGASFQFVDRAVVMHHHRTTLKGLYYMGYKVRFGRELLVHKFRPCGVIGPTVSYELILYGWSLMRDLALGNERYQSRSWILYDYAFRTGGLRGFFAGRRFLHNGTVEQVDTSQGFRPLVSDPYGSDAPTGPRAIRSGLRRGFLAGLYGLNLAAKKILPEKTCEEAIARYRRYLRHPVQKMQQRASLLTKDGFRILNLDFYDWVKADVAHKVSSRYPRVVMVNAPPHDVLFEHGEPTELPTLMNYREIHWHGLNLWELCKVSLCKHVGKLPGEAWTNEEMPVVAQYYHWAQQCLVRVTELLDDVQPDAVLVCQGGVYDSRCVVELARRRGIRCVATENSFAGTHFIADAATGVVVNRHTLGLSGAFANETEQLDTAALARAKRFFETQLHNKDIQHKTGGIASADAIQATLALPDQKRLVLFLAQVRYDASIVLDSVVWPDPADLVAALASYVEQRDDLHLVVRLHPKEEREVAYSHGRRHRDVFDHSSEKAIRERGLDNHPNLTLVGGTEISTHVLMQMADVGVTVNSQAGLEMALLDRPVVTCGRCFYAGAGFTWDVRAPAQLDATMDAALAEDLSQDARSQAWRFAHHLFFDYLFPKSLDAGVPRLARVFGVPVGRKQAGDRV